MNSIKTWVASWVGGALVLLALSAHGQHVTNVIIKGPSQVKAGQSFTLSWSSFGSQGGDYRVERRTAGGSWQEIADTGSGTSIQHQGLAVSTWEFRVRRCYTSSTVCYLETPVKAVVVTANLPPLSGPSQAIEGESFVLYWSGFGSSGGYYSLQRRKAGGSWAEVANAGSYTYVWHSANAGDWEFRVRRCYVSYYCYASSDTKWVAVRKPSARVEYSYDALGRLRTSSDDGGGGSTNYNYDDAGNRTSVEASN